MHPPSAPRRTRWIPLALVGTVVSTLLVVAPTPQVVAGVPTAEVRTEHVRFAPAPGTASSASTRRGSGVVSAGYEMIGVTLPAPPAGELRVRGRVAGAWTPWFDVHFDTGDAPDRGSETPRPGLHSEPIWMGDADAYELDAPPGVDGADVHLVDESSRSSVELVTPAATAATAPSIQPRSAWGAAPPTEHPATTADLKLAVVHHSVSSNTYAAGEVPALLRSIQAYHQGVQGWNDFAYNFAVDRFGRIWEGRAGGTTNVVLGGHSQGFNTGSVGVVVLGDFTSASPPTAAVEATANVIAWKFAIHHVSPGTTVPVTSAGSSKYPSGTTVTLPRVVGHRDVQSTSCPGSSLYGRLSTIRSRVAQLVPSYQASALPVLLGPDVSGDGLLDPLEYHAGATADVQWRASGLGQLTSSGTSVSGTYRPATGDLDGDGDDDVLWHGTGSAPDRIWWSGPGGPTTEAVTVGGSYVPVVGDFDGDGVDDVFWYGTGLYPDRVWYFARNRTVTSVAATQALVTGVPLVGDFDGDGRDDIFWYGPGTADDSLYRSAGRRFEGLSRTVDGWFQPVVQDANGDGRDDILWHSPGSTTAIRWEMTASATHLSRHLTVPAILGRPHAGDFDGDGLEDAILPTSGTPADSVWYSTLTGVRARAVSVSGTYLSVVGPMDLGALAGTDDVFFLSPTGSDYLWRGRTDGSFSTAQVG